MIAVVALAGIGWGIAALYDRSAKLEAEKYQVVRNWQADVKENLQVDLTARTKLVDGRLYASVIVRGYPAYLSNPKLHTKNQNAYIFLTFEDDDGFKVYEKSIKVSEFSTTVDARNEKIGLNYEFDEYLGVASYKRFSRLAIRWNLDTVIPPEVAPVPTKPKVSIEDGSSDHCAPGLSKAERMRRLAKHGTVRQTGEDNYSVGLRSLTFYPASIGGGLLSCR